MVALAWQDWVDWSCASVDELASRSGLGLGWVRRLALAGAGCAVVISFMGSNDFWAWTEFWAGLGDVFSC